MAMKWNNSDSASVTDEVNDICQSDNNSYPLASKARRTNAAMDRFMTLAFQADGRWAYDDINQTTAPLESINLVSGTEKYALDTFASEIIKILRVEILDSNGVGYTIGQLDEDGVLPGVLSLPQYNSVAALPMHYRLFGKYIYLYPKPNYNSTNGLSLYFSRNKVPFTAASTTATLGVPSIFEQYICNLTALPYLIEFQKGQKNDIAALIQKDEAAILQYFGTRNEADRHQMTMAPIRHR